MKKLMGSWNVLVTVAVFVMLTQAIKADIDVPLIVTHPKDVVLEIGATHELFIETSTRVGDEISYQWFVSANSDKTESKPLLGSIGKNCQVKGSPTTMYYFVTVTYTLPGGEKKIEESNVAVVSSSHNLNAETPFISANPQNVETELGKEITLLVDASVTDGGNLSYQWARNTDIYDSTSWQSIEGATAKTFVPDVSRIGKVYYKVKVTNSNNNVLGESVASQTSYPVVVVVVDNGVKNAKFPIVTGPWLGFDVGKGKPTEMRVTAESVDGGILSWVEQPQMSLTPVLVFRHWLPTTMSK